MKFIPCTQLKTFLGTLGTHLKETLRTHDYWNEMGCIDCKDIKINDLLKREKESIFYEYDFGDGWVHKIKLVKILK